MSISNLKFKICIFFLLFACCLLPITNVRAQTTDQSIIVYPAVTELQARPGETVRFLIQFRNNGSVPVSGNIKIADFTVKDDQGTPVILEDESEKPPYAASLWIRANSEKITIPSNDFVAVYFNADIPQNLQTCGNYAVVYFENDSSSPIGTAVKTTSSSSITTKIGALVNFTVRGKVCKEGLTLGRLNFPFFSENGPIKFTFDLINNGDYHLIPKGTLYTLNMFNKRADEKTLAQKRIFPGGAKKYEMEIGKKWMFGRYQLVLSGIYGQKNLPIYTNVYFWVFPWRIALTIILGLILFYLLIKHYHDLTHFKEESLAHELEKEKEEIKRLKEKLKKRD